MPLGEQRFEAIVFGTLVGLHRDLEVREVQALHQLDELDRGGDERLDGLENSSSRRWSGSEPELTPMRIGVPELGWRPR
jgi:hypothetical protein